MGGHTAFAHKAWDYVFHCLQIVAYEAHLLVDLSNRQPAS